MDLVEGGVNIPSRGWTRKRWPTTDHHRPPIICRTKGKKKRVRNGRIFTDSELKLGILLIGWTSGLQLSEHFSNPWRNQRGTATFRKFDEYARNFV